MKGLDCLRSILLNVQRSHIPRPYTNKAKSARIQGRLDQAYTTRCGSSSDAIADFFRVHSLQAMRDMETTLKATQPPSCQTEGHLAPSTGAVL